MLDRDRRSWYWPFMKGLVIGASLVLAASASKNQDVGELALEQFPFSVYSAFWPNLHHVLWAEAWARRPSSEEKAGSLPEPLTGNLTADERRAWDDAVSYYDREVANLDLLFEMREMRKLLIKAEGRLPPKGLTLAHHQPLAKAAPVYRKYWWPAHDRANRAWLADAMSKVASLSPVVPDRLAQLYGTPWFNRSVRVDVLRVGSRQGAYTSKDPPPAHITISSSKTALADWMAAELLFHESSHALVGPIIAAFNAELRAQGKEARDLWHAALFYTTGEVVRQTLAKRGIAYEPYLYKTGLFDRAWPRFKQPIENYWKTYVDGEMPRDEAINKVVAAIQ